MVNYVHRFIYAYQFPEVSLGFIVEFWPQQLQEDCLRPALIEKENANTKLNNNYEAS